MTNQSLSENCRKKESRIHKFEVDVSRASTKLVDVFTHSSNVWAWLADLLAQSIEVLI